jgi:hypothetical protein
MQAEQLAVELRVRGGWEATDLGFQMLRNSALRIWPVFVLHTLPFFVLSMLVLWQTENLFFAMMLFWWFKPWMDRVPLFVLSRQLFGTLPTQAEVWRASWRFGLKEIIPWLLWRRLHFYRSLIMPIDMLEQLPIERRSARASVIAGASNTVGIWLTKVCLVFEQAIIMAFFGFIFMMVPIEFLPDNMQDFWESLESWPIYSDAMWLVFYYLSVLLIEPFFVAGGFGLYINCRTRLEAWDIELVFRRMVKRLSQYAAMVLCATGLLLSASNDANAQRGKDSKYIVDAEYQDAESESENTDDAEAEADSSDVTPRPLTQLFSDDQKSAEQLQGALDKAFKGPELSPKISVPKPDEPEQLSEPRFNFGGFGEFFGGAVKLLMWVLGFALLFAVLLYLAKRMPALNANDEEPELLNAEAELDIEEPLPDDFLSVAQRLFTEQQPRAAIALLYRALLHHVNLRLGEGLPRGCTESLCLSKIRELEDAPLLSIAKPLVRTWQEVAYAKLPLQAESFQALVQSLSTSPLATLKANSL